MLQIIQVNKNSISIIMAYLRPPSVTVEIEVISISPPLSSTKPQKKPPTRQPSYPATHIQ